MTGNPHDVFKGFTAGQNRRIALQILTWYKEGSDARDVLTANPYSDDSIAHIMFLHGHTKRDIQIHLCLNNNEYMRNQVMFGQITMDLLEREAKRLGMQSNEQVKTD